MSDGPLSEGPSEEPTRPLPAPGEPAPVDPLLRADVTPTRPLHRPAPSDPTPPEGTAPAPEPGPDLGPDAGPVEEPGAAPGRLRGRRRGLVLAASALAVAVAAVVIAVTMRSDAARPTPTLDAWAPYWALETSLPELGARAGAINELSPFWYVTTGVDDIAPDPNAPAELTEDFLDAARRTGARLVPSVVDAMPAGGMAAIVRDPAQRARHVDALGDLAEELDADGLDIDYERFAFADDRSTWPTTRPAWVAFITELADRLHADGRTLAVSIPPVYDDERTDESGYWVYDYGAIAPVVDRIRVMAYDFSTATAGPIAPLDWVQRAIDGTAEAAGDPSKLVLGLPLYGYNWPVTSIGECPEDAEGRTGVTARNAEELAARRGGTPVFDEITGEWSFSYSLEVSDGTRTCTQERIVHWVDNEGALARLELARDAGFAGGSLWALGYEDEAFWPLLAPPETSVP